MKQDGVRDVCKWLDTKCKEQKKKLNDLKQQKSRGELYYFEGGGEYMIREEQVRLDTLVEIKKSTEKYYKKLKHEEESEWD